MSRCEASLDKCESNLFVLEVVDRGILIFGRFHYPEVSLLTKTYIFQKCTLFVNKLLDNTGINHAFLIDEAVGLVAQIPTD